VGKIRVLPDAVANQIAAGEVVERPASVVKELLENSLDAGAFALRVEAAGGGRRLLRITDDGHGMLRDDAMLAFERHATSKLSALSDLLSIATLGFRGEALPSIASVSRLTLETRSALEATGTRVEIQGGKLVSCEEAALASGTIVTVRDLFFNVPARKKFLRSEQTELAHIAQLVTHYSLAFPEKAFELCHDGKELLHVTPVEGLRDRVFQVFGGQTLADLIDLGARETELRLPGEPGEEEPQQRVFLLRGFVSRPQVQKLNRNSIFLFVNRRLIRDRLLMHAISSAYHNLMPPACFPFALLFLDCDALEVDVNVHPSKTEVRFRQGSFVHDFVRDAIRETLTASRPVSTVSATYSPQPAAGLPFSEFTQAIENQRFREAPVDLPEHAPAPGETLPEMTLRSYPTPASRLDFSGPSISVEARPAPSSRIPDTHGPFPEEFLVEPARGMGTLDDLRPLGQIHNSFIIAAGRDGLWIIDQHVAHERILFEKVLRERAAGRVESQRLLMPMVLELTAAQQIEYARIAGELSACGFETEPFGVRTIAVKAAPAALGQPDIERALFEVLEIAEAELRKVSVDDLGRDIAASIACRAAIKINTRLDPARMEWLLRSLAACEFPMSCPHGRPIALRYATRDILKGFHRL
jgi:DNA mismatch repair protein MutL